MRTDVPPHLPHESALSVLPEEAPSVFGDHFPLHLLRHPGQKAADAPPLFFIGETGKVQPVRPVPPVGVLIPGGVDVVAPAVGGGYAAREKALLGRNGGVQLHSPPDLRRILPHPRVAGRFKPGHDGVHHQPGV